MKKESLSQSKDVADSILFFQACGGKTKQGRVYRFGFEVNFYGSRSSSNIRAHNSRPIKNGQLHARAKQLENLNEGIMREMTEMCNYIQNNAGNQHKSSTFVTSMVTPNVGDGGRVDEDHLSDGDVGENLNDDRGDNDRDDMDYDVGRDNGAYN
ncbi:hypothetical protein C2S51_008226 [Perilla frutescens var. frutescens]|nr:hypothetical protein C2S51_008226 [Perilla frutescens var. frutescens]